MITCANCRHQEIDGALFCSLCGAQISASTRISPADQALKDQSTASQIPFPAPPSETLSSSLALHVVDAGDIIHISEKKDIAIGRATEGQIIVPDIDLTPYDAYEAGVSRLHVNICVGKSKITVQDLESANGTRLNGVKIAPHSEYKLEHGDILTLGTLKLQIFIRE